VAVEVCQLELAESEEIVATTDDVAVDAEYVLVSAAGLRLEAVGYAGPGNEENSDLGAVAESSVVAGYHLA